MANLIIKSSADNLVLQGSDASPAITVGATGTTTFAENTTLSGTANAIGTVATGNISNTAIVYPAGHILQTGTASATILSDTEVYDEHHASAGGFFAGNFMSGTLSAGTYTFDAQGNKRSGSGSVYWISANPGPSSASIATITLMEIAG